MPSKLLNKQEIEKLLSDFAPDKQLIYCRQLERCITGNAPTLQQVENQTGKEFFSLKWIEIQLVDLAVFCGVKEKFTDEQLKQTAQVIFLNFSRLKLTELMLFFQKLKSGEYGKFYGVADPMALMENLQKFKKWLYNERYQILTKKENEEKEKNFEAWLNREDVIPIYMHIENEKKNKK